jgi:hypothetical protein
MKTKQLAQERIREESAQLELAQQKHAEEMRASEAAKERLGVEHRAMAEVESRINAEQIATEASRQRELAEILAQEAANEKLIAQEQTISAMRAREEMDRQLTAFERKEFDRITAENETGHLMMKLRKTSIISKVSQVALAASLVFSLSFLVVGGSSVATAGGANQAVATHNGADTAKADAQPAKAIVLASLKMSTELGSYPSRSTKATAKN